MSASQTPGAIIASRYRLDRLLGEGGMGSVWAATHLVTHKLVALKFLKGANASAEMVKRFMREARAVSAVRHPNVVEVHDVIDHEGHPVMVMDLLNGESLGARLAREGALPLPEFARIMLPIVSAIGKAHAAGIVHRDLKPDNIFLDLGPDGQAEPKVLDFGIAKFSAPEGAAAATAHLTSTGAVMGTPYYMAPEQVFGEKDLDQRADVWAIGVMSYECLSARKPFDGDNVGQLFKAIVTGQIVALEKVAPQLPRDVTDAIGRLLRKDRDERARDLRELYNILQRYSTVQAEAFSSAKSMPLPSLDTSSGEVSAEVSALAGTIRLPLERRRWATIAVGTVVVAGAVTVGAFVLSKRAVNREAPPLASSLESPMTESALAPTAAPEPAPAAQPSAAPVAVESDAGKTDLRRAATQPRAQPAASKPTAAANPTPPAPAAPSRAPGTIVEPPPF